jgi:hypothetical protein
MLGKREKRDPVIVVHDAAQAEAALRAARATGVPVTLWSAPGASEYAGLGFLSHVFEGAAKAVPDAPHDVVIDCARSGALAHEAIRSGFSQVAFAGRGEMRTKLIESAVAYGGTLITEGPGRRALDLNGSADPVRECTAYLSSRQKRRP